MYIARGLTLATVLALYCYAEPCLAQQTTSVQSQSKAEGLGSIAGIRLGMTPSQAREALLAHNEELKNVLQVDIEEKSTGDGRYQRGLRAFLVKKNASDPMDDTLEEVNVLFSEFGSNPVLVVQRTIGGEKIAVSSLASTVRDTYHIELGTDRSTSNQVAGAIYLAPDGTPTKNPACPQMAIYNSPTGTASSFYRGYKTQASCGAFIRILAERANPNKEMVLDFFQLLIDTQGLNSERAQASRVAGEATQRRQKEEVERASAKPQKM